MNSVVSSFKKILSTSAFSAAILLGVMTLAPTTTSAGFPSGTSGSPGNTAQSEVCDAIGGCDTNPNSSTSINGTLAFIVNLLSIILGVAAVIMIIVGGLKYVTSDGDSNKVSSAKGTITYAIIGLVIAILAKPLVNLVLGAFGK